VASRAQPVRVTVSLADIQAFAVVAAAAVVLHLEAVWQWVCAESEADAQAPRGGQLAALPLVGAATSTVAVLIATSAIVEQIFGWPGIGAATIAAALESDLALLLATSLGTALIVIIAGWLGDGLAWLIDPRIRHA